jgi:PAS domain S-box-containing protein
VAGTAEDAARWTLAETLLGEAAAGLSLPVLITNDELCYVAVNRAAEELLGYSRDELLDLRVDDIVERTADRLRAVSYEIERDRFRTGTTTARCTDGTRVTVGYTSAVAIVALLPHIVTVCWPQGDE